MALSLGSQRRRQGPAEDSAGFGAIAERFRRAGELERAVTLCQEGLQRYPTHLSSRVTLGWALLDLGRYDEARTELEQVLKRAPDNLAAIRGLAQLHDRAQHDDMAMSQNPADWTPPADAEEPVVDSAEEIFADAPMWVSPSVAIEPDAQAERIEIIAPAAAAFAETEPIESALHIEPAVTLDFESDRDFQLEPELAREVTPAQEPRLDFDVEPVIDEDVSPVAGDLTPVDMPMPVVEPSAAAQPTLVFSNRYPALPAPHTPSFAPPPPMTAAERRMQFVDPLPNGPGPWPPVIVDDEQEAAVAAAQAAGQWPPPQTAPLRPVALTTVMPKTEKKGALGALARFGKRVQSRRRDSQSIYVAG